MTNYYNEVQNEKIIGEITNVFLYDVHRGSKSENFVRYTSYNLIFTNSFLLGDSLPSPGTVTDDMWLNLIQGNQKFENLSNYLKQGTVVEKDMSSINAEHFNNINIKIPYENIKKITLENYVPTTGLLGAKHPLANCTILDLDIGLLDLLGKKFLLSQDLSDKANALVKKTPLSNKI